jgi:hypothetical protein
LTNHEGQRASPAGALAHLPTADMRLRSILILLSAALILLSRMIVAYLLVVDHPDDSQPIPATDATAEQYGVHQVVMNFTYWQFNDQQLKEKIIAKALLVKPRRLVFFNIKGVREAVLVNAQISLYFDDVAPDQPALFPFTSQRATDRRSTQSGKTLLEKYDGITRAVIEGLVLNIHNQNGLMLVVYAKRATQQGKDSAWLLESAVLSQPKTGRRIFSEQLSWYEQDRLFKIPKRYLLLTEDGQRHEQNPARLNLELIPVQP